MDIYVGNYTVKKLGYIHSFFSGNMIRCLLLESVISLSMNDEVVYFTTQIMNKMKNLLGYEEDHHQVYTSCLIH